MFELRRTDLVTEDLDLAGCSVDELVGAGAEIIGVDLQVEREAFHAFLGREVCAEGVQTDVHLEDKVQV